MYSPLSRDGVENKGKKESAYSRAVFIFRRLLPRHIPLAAALPQLPPGVCLIRLCSSFSSPPSSSSPLYHPALLFFLSPSPYSSVFSLFLPALLFPARARTSSKLVSSSHVGAFITAKHSCQLKVHARRARAAGWPRFSGDPRILGLKLLSACVCMYVRERGRCSAELKKEKEKMSGRGRSGRARAVALNSPIR